MAHLWYSINILNIDTRLDGDCAQDRYIVKKEKIFEKSQKNVVVFSGAEKLMSIYEGYRIENEMYMGVDTVFIILQRYNRPTLLRLIDRQKGRARENK